MIKIIFGFFVYFFVYFSSEKLAYASSLLDFDPSPHTGRGPFVYDFKNKSEITFNDPKENDDRGKGNEEIFMNWTGKNVDKKGEEIDINFSCFTDNIYNLHSNMKVSQRGIEVLSLHLDDKIIFFNRSHGMNTNMGEFMMVTPMNDNTSVSMGLTPNNMEEISQSKTIGIGLSKTRIGEAEGIANFPINKEKMGDFMKACKKFMQSK